ncbi:Hsp70 family protein [Dongia soli]|uniref:Hsp70 family protein n=1 Tax=Dongia soli TaxID=600628 RepID=A0ABU5EGT1_9PROT|nr:Hsp70 family protein [Dongia soli]MDY0885112.1 Hsp70 family protein [Dongia soli]
MRARHCGLDFGTSNSTLGFRTGAGYAMCPLDGDSPTLPSAVFFDYEEDRVQFGRGGIAAYITGVEGRLLRALKSVLGSQLIGETTLIGRKRVPMRAIIGMFLRQMKKLAEQRLGHEIDNVVLGRPVRFVDEDDMADRRAEEELVGIAKEQGFRHVATQLEPIAAALAYEQSLSQEELSLIVDLGGGTSDFVIARLSPEGAQRSDRSGDILGRSGVHVGGTDFDCSLSIAQAMPHLGYHALIGPKRLPMPSHLFHDLATWHKIPFLYTPQNISYLRSIIDDSDQPARLERLLHLLSKRQGHQLAGEVEAAKIALSDAMEAILHLPRDPEAALPDAAFTVTRADLDEAVSRDTGRIIAAIDRCCREAAVNPAHLQSVFLTGGSTGIPSVRRRILEHVANARPVAGDMFGSVGLGLAIDADRRFG